MIASYLLGLLALVAAGSEAQTSGSSSVKPSSTASSSSSSSSSSTTTSSPITTHTISVGADGFKFTPNEIKDALIGDIIEFHFYPGGHSVVRAEFEHPCIPYEYTGAGKTGFFSGLRSPQVISNDPSTIFQVRINKTEPVFLYCSAPGSCFQEHMIGVINPNSTQTLARQMEFAMNATFQLSPLDPFPSESVTPTATPSSTNLPANSSGNGSSDSGVKLGPGAIAGVAIGGVAVLVLAGVLIYLCGRRGGFNRAYRRSTATMAIFPPPMVDGKFTPKSPGQETFSTRHYSTQGSPQQQYMQSPGMTSPGPHPQYYTSPDPRVHSPPMGSIQHQHGYLVGRPTPQPELVGHSPPVELPTSSDPGHSPLPIYNGGRQFSWAQNSEGQYRPGDKS